MITIVIYVLCIVYLLYYVNKHQEKKKKYSGNFQLFPTTFNDLQQDTFTIPVHLTCPTTFEAVGDGCYAQAGQGVNQSADCVAECGDDAQPAEVHSTEQLDALKAYVNGDDANHFVMGNNTIVFLVVDS